MLALACAGLFILVSPSPAEEKHEESAGPRSTGVGPVVKAVTEGDVARGAVLARELVGSGRLGGMEAVELRMLFTKREHRRGLLDGLADADAALRAACAWALGWIHDWESAAEVERLLEDPEATVRFEAARAMGEFGELRLAGRLARAVADADAGVRRAALDSLKKLGTGFEVGVRALSDDSLDVRHAAASLLCEVRTDSPELKVRAARALDSVLGDARNGARWEVRFAAAVALGRLGITDGVPALARAARGADERVSLAAITALGDVGGEGAARALVGIILAEIAGAEIAGAGGPLAQGVVESLGRTGVRSRGVIEALAGIVREGPLEVARTAADALAALGGGAARKALVEASRSARTEVHGAVAVAAARLEEYRPAAALLRELDDEDEWTALGAARSLAEIGNAAGFPVLIGALRSQDERVCAFAATCLALHSGARMDLWTDGSPSERERIARTWRRWWLTNRDTFTVRRTARPGSRGLVR